jgi:hypothetical protein
MSITNSSHWWSITHLPSGLRLPWSFWNIEDATEAMSEIIRLKNSWAVFEPSDITDELKESIKSIVDKFGGFRIPNGTAVREFAPRFNGYSPESA